jgi:two-component sensor histidine kinase
MAELSGQEREGGALDKVRRHIRILVDIGRLAGENGDLDRFLDQAVMQVARAVEIDHVKVLRYRPRTADLLVVAGLGWKEGVVGTATLSADLRSAPGRAFQTAEPVTIKTFDEQEEYVRSDFLNEHGILSLTNVPLLIDGAAWGVLEVDSTTPRDFSEDTTDFMTAAAALIGAFVRRHSAKPDEAAPLIAAATEAQKRDVLLREMQHRVKNNFQLILASISIQKRRYSGGEVHRALDHLQAALTRSRLHTTSLPPDTTARLSDFPITSTLCASRSANRVRQSKSTWSPTNSN